MTKILCWKRPVTVSFIDHVDRIYELISYITQGYLRCDKDMDVPKECAIMNALYRNECAVICKEYAKIHKCPEGPVDNFKSDKIKRRIYTPLAVILLNDTQDLLDFLAILGFLVQLDTASSRCHQEIGRLTWTPVFTTLRHLH